MKKILNYLVKGEMDLYDSSHKLVKTLKVNSLH